MTAVDVHAHVYTMYKFWCLEIFVAIQSLHFLHQRTQARQSFYKNEKILAHKVKCKKRRFSITGTRLREQGLFVPVIWNSNVTLTHFTSKQLS